MLIDFSEIPGTSKLFLDYINDFEKVEKYYRINFRNEEAYTSLFEKITARNNTNKTDLIEIIKGYYKKFTPSDKTKQNIELLNDDKTIAVFTGQQIGILGGPLYTFYKIFTAVKLSEYLSSKFTQYNFVPVFWMAGDDHDFEEISYVNIVNKENELSKIIYSDGFEPQFNRGSVGDLNFLNSIKEFKDKVMSEIRETEFSKNFFELIDNILIPGLPLKESFFNLLYQIFDDTGLIIFNPQDPEVKKLLKPIFKKEITDFKDHTKQLLLESAELDESYHAQVKIKPINLFMSDESGRNLIEPIEDEFKLKGKRKRITREELLNKIEKEPEKFSANVLLRPICEDYLFPTGFYIGGPGEISYYAQVIPLYKKFNLQHPIIFPRASATIIEKNIAKILIKYNFSTIDFFKEKDQLKEDLIKSVSNFNLDNDFNLAEQSISESLNLLSTSISKVDNNLKNLTETTKGKLLHQLNVLKEKSKKAQEQRFDAALRQITKAQNLIYPNENLQERELTIINFINKYGFDFFDWLYNELDIAEFKHQILEI